MGPIKWSRKKFTPVTNSSKKKKKKKCQSSEKCNTFRSKTRKNRELWERGWVGELRRTSGKSYLSPRVCVTNPLHLSKQIKEQEALGCCLGGRFYLWVEVVDSGTNWFHVWMDSYQARLAQRIPEWTCTVTGVRKKSSGGFIVYSHFRQLDR